MTREPLRSVMPFRQVEETSLALPSDDKLRSGQQRVLDQVHTMKRSKSRSSTNGSGPASPTSPTSVNIFNKNITSRINLSNLAGNMKTSKEMSMSRMNSSNQYEKMMYGFSGTDGGFTGLKTARMSSLSNPELAPPRPQTKRYLSSIPTAGSNVNSYGMGIISQPHIGGISSNYQRVKTNTINSKIKSGSNTLKSSTILKEGSDITLKEAVEFLSSKDENLQNFGASVIQHDTFSEEKAKQEVFQLKGIPPLVALLRSSSPQVQETASGALRNLVFKNSSNKLEVQRCGGVTEVLELLKKTDSDETKKQLTGLLWNLSSSDALKPELIRTALPVLTESILVPYVDTSEKNTGGNMDPEVFYNATACLRNLSSGKKNDRQSMRNCRGLINSLVSYIQTCVEADRTDDKSVENCMCILHNLTYQLETEAPSLFSKITALARPPTRSTAQKNSSPMGCFSQQSSKVEQESYFDYPVMEDNNPQGAGRLLHSSTMQTYLDLLGKSEKDSTREACIGALQNLTAQKGTVSSVMSQTIVQKLNGLPNIAPLLHSSNSNLQKAATALVGNFSRTPRLQSILARQALPQLATILTSGAKDGGNSDDTMAVACHTIGNLLKAEPGISKKLLNNTLINSLVDLSRNSYLPKSSQAAALLLHGVWADKDFQSILKKQGMNKGSFMNDITTSAFKSAAQSVLMSAA